MYHHVVWQIYGGAYFLYFYMMKMEVVGSADVDKCLPYYTVTTSQKTSFHDPTLKHHRYYVFPVCL